MRENFGYKGYRYQKRCALAYLLKVYGQSKFRGIGMECPDSDDFDLRFEDERRVYQVKDIASPSRASMKKCLGKMLRKYLEDIRPELKAEAELERQKAGLVPDELSAIDVTMGFIFSKSGKCPAWHAVAGKDTSSSELGALGVELCQELKKNVGEWLPFTKKLSLRHLPHDKLNDEIESLLGLALSGHEGDDDLDEADSEFRALLNRTGGKFLELLDTAMAQKKVVPRATVKELLRSVHIENWRTHAKVRREARQQDDKLMRDSLMDNKHRSAIDSGEIQ